MSTELFLPKLDGVPQAWRHEKCPIAAVERKRIFLSAVLANDLDGAIDADHELRAAPMSVAAALRTGRRCQSKHALDPERYLLCDLSHNHFAIPSRVTRQID